LEYVSNSETKNEIIVGQSRSSGAGLFDDQLGCKNLSYYGPFTERLIQFSQLVKHSIYNDCDYDIENLATSLRAEFVRSRICKEFKTQAQNLETAKAS
jgi:hypothetical protein